MELLETPDQFWCGDETEEQHNDTEEKHEIEDLSYYDGEGYDARHSGGGDGGKRILCMFKFF